MEAVREDGGLLNEIRPPRLEDAGLEDCALPPDSIKEAFLKAATAVRSVLSPSDGEDESDCVSDPWQTSGEPSDKLVGIASTTELQGPCRAEKGGGLPDLTGDEVAAGVAGAINDEGKKDEVVEPELPAGGKACVEGLQGLKIEGKVKEEDDEEEDEGPFLAEGYV
ncbi:uncharacterized protein LOC131157758 [Malania oleifera]|uniref:uncharacterized protein LOC131157758 n=1 Tax=Malania oleifera TaxID=397392 RepID=UPI0025ADAC15|nr:uncharacterized protein LOC131157758 [Malania oleifera]